MYDYVRTIVNALVDHPDKIQIAEVQGQKTLVYEVRCHPDDLGKLIGKAGKTVSAIRTLLGAVASRSNQRVMIEVAD